MQIHFSFLVAFLCTCSLSCSLLYGQNYEQSIRDIDAKLRTSNDPDSIDAYLMRGAILSRAHDHLHNWISYTVEFLGNDPAHRDTFNHGELLEIWRTPRDNAEASIAIHYYRHMGYHYTRDGNTALSTEYYVLALELYEHHRIADLDVFEEILKPLGNNYLRLGDFERAQDIAYRMQDWTRNTTTPDGHAAYFNFLGLMHKLKGEYALASEAYGHGLEIKEAGPEILGKLASNLSLLLSEHGDDALAEEYAYAAMEHLQQLPASPEANEDLAITLLLIAQIRYHRRDFETAYEFIEHALSLSSFVDTRTYAKMLIVRGNILRQVGYPEHAIQTFHAAIAQFDPSFATGDLVENPRLENITPENTVFEALEGKADALIELFRSFHDEQYALRALECHKLALEAELQLRSHLSAEFSRNVLSADSKRRNSKALSILAALQNTDTDVVTDAFRLMESAKANAVLEAITQRIDDAMNKTDDADQIQLAEQIRKQERELYHLKSASNVDATAVAESERRVNQFKLQLAEKCIGSLRNLQEYTSTVKDQLQSGSSALSIPNRDSTLVLIEYFIHGDAGYAVLITAGEKRFIALGEVDRIRSVTMDLVSSLHSREITNASMQEFGQSAHWLYQRLIGDIITERGDISSLIIIPDGELNYLPFEVLLTDYNPGTTYGDMPYMIRDYVIHYAHSAGVLSIQRQLPVNSSGGVAFAPFETSQRGLSDLPYSLEEIHASNDFGLRKFTGARASFRNFISAASSGRIIHLATHAGVDSAGRGHIEFADSVLLLSDVYYLPLQCELAILSACESAFGENLSSEGIQNFARAFAIAGTKSVIASHWRLNDAAGANIIRGFYQHLRKNNSIAGSLRQAKLDYLLSTETPMIRKSPHYWASLVMVGADGHVEPEARSRVVLTLAVIVVVFVFWIVWVFIVRLGKPAKTS